MSAVYTWWEVWWSLLGLNYHTFSMIYFMSFNNIYMVFCLVRGPWRCCALSSPLREGDNPVQRLLQQPRGGEGEAPVTTACPEGRLR